MFLYSDLKAMTGGRPRGFAQLRSEGSPASGDRDQMPETRVFWCNFACFGCKTEFLMKFLDLDDSAWFCVEELKKDCFSIKNIFLSINGPGPENFRKMLDKFLLIGPLKGALKGP